MKQANIEQLQSQLTRITNKIATTQGLQRARLFIKRDVLRAKLAKIQRGEQ